MIEVKQDTKLAQSIIRGYKYSTPSNHAGLYAIYKNPSDYKLSVYDEWEHYFYEVARSKGGYPDIIINIGVSGNSMTFSIYCYISDGTKGDLYYITKSYNRVIREIAL